MGDDGDDDGPFGQEEQDGEPAENHGGRDLTRRRVYLQRLIGDSLLTPKKVRVRVASKLIILRFGAYLGIAMSVILTRSNVETINDQRRAVRQAVTRTPFTYDGIVEYFEDISNNDEMWAWLQQVLIQRVLGSETSAAYRRPLTIFSYNRVAPIQGCCTEGAAISITMRRAATTDNFEKTTSKRFSALYPRAWVGDGVPAGAASSEAEATDTLHGVPPEGYRSYDWLHTPSGGYNAQGGYLATITISDGEVYYHLLDPDAEPYYNRSEGACGIRSSATLSADEFAVQGYVDDQFTSLAISFVLYNANLQTLSIVAVIFNRNYAGLVVDSSVVTDTIGLDIYSPTMRYVDIIYLMFTTGYFFDWCWTFKKGFPGSLVDLGIWINLISILASVSGIALWYLYTPYLNRALATGEMLVDPNELAGRASMLQLWKQASAIAGLTIFLRLLHYLALVESRVLLLQRTLSMGAGMIVTYYSYILVVFWGFTAFANMYFAAFSSDYSSLWASAISNFQMFFGQDTAIEAVDSAATFKSGYYVPFMLFFYFISMQMFNAIINYAYNRVSEEMEPQFEQERNAAKRRQQRRAEEGWGPSYMLQQLRERLAAMLGEKAPQMLPWFLQVRNKDEADQKANSKTVESATPAFESLDPEVKAQVENFLDEDRSGKSQDGVLNQLFFLCFAAAYIWFLYTNLSVNDNFQIYYAISDVVSNTPMQREDGVLDTWDNMGSLRSAAYWFESALPAIIFNTTSADMQARAVLAGLYNASAVCLKSWNCMVELKQGLNANGTQLTGPSKIARITQRRAKDVDNRGKLSADTPDEYRFVGGKDELTGRDVSQVMLPLRSAGEVGPLDAPNVDLEDLDLALPPNTSDWCTVAPIGDVTSFRGYGGISCFMDGDYGNFTNQIEVMLANGWLAPTTSAIVIDFAMQNSNKGLLSYVAITFAVQPSGRLDTEVKVTSIKLFNFNDWLNNFSDLVLRLLPGCIYLLLTLWFLKQLRDDFKQDYIRRKLKDKTGLLAKDKTGLLSLVNFMRSDIFNLLEATSIFISIFSAVLFFTWLVQDIDISRKQASQYAIFLNYLEALTEKASLYNRLSALNILLIAVRPLKFVRENARMASLYASLWGATQDIQWFILMLFTTLAGFTMFCYVSFGPYLEQCATLLDSLVYCFQVIHGEFDLLPLMQADVIMSAFMFPYIVIMSCVFANIFFAIVDRYFISVDPPPFQWKRKLKPLFGRICRCIEWDEDFVMEQDPNAEVQKGPPSRADRVKDTQKKIQEILNRAGALGAGRGFRRHEDIHEVIDVDERIDTVLTWSRAEARNIYRNFADLLAKKQNQKRDELQFIQDVMGWVHKEVSTMTTETEEAARMMRYATRVDENSIMGDQDTLARYILLLERRIARHSAELRVLESEVTHLRTQAERLEDQQDRQQTMESILRAAAAKAMAGPTEGAEGEEEEEEDEDESVHSSREGEEEAVAVPEAPEAEDAWRSVAEMAQHNAAVHTPTTAAPTPQPHKQLDPTAPRIRVAADRPQRTAARTGMLEVLGIHRSRQH